MDRKMRKTMLCLAAAMMAGSTASASAETLILPINQGFEANVYTVFPGYIAGNGGVLTGWTASDNTRAGLNPGGGTPFADNGTRPGPNSQVAFIQSNGVATTLSQNVGGFTVGDRYVVYYRENNRDSQIDGFASTTLGGSTVVAGHVTSPVLGANPYRTVVSGVHTATGTTQTLAFTNSTGVDSTVLIDDVRVYGYTADEVIVLNHSFEWDTFSTSPGYSNGAGNGDIAGWTSTNTARTGINPWTGGSPFADNGTIPNGTKVAFIQNSGGTGTLSQTINGLTIGETYRVDFRTNARSGLAPQLTATFGAGTLLSAQSVTAVGGGSPYHVYSYTVTATSTSQTLTFANVNGGGDSTVLLDAIKITENPAWTATQWSNNATSGITQNGTYSHALNFGSSAGALINGVGFTGNASANPSDTTYSLTGYGNVFTNDANNVTDVNGSDTIANDFVFGGNPGTLTLRGLIPGSSNVLTIYGVGFDGAGPNMNRAATFTHPATGETITVNENQFGQDNGIKVQYRYVADATGTAVISISPMIAANTFHVYGVANETKNFVNLFTDNFNANGNPVVINPAGTDKPGRQTGLYAPLNYTERPGTDGNFTQIGNSATGADRLFIAAQPGVGPNPTTASPDHNFEIAGGARYQFMFDVNPDNNASTGADISDDDWAQFVFGSSSQTAGVNGSDGIGLLIRGNGGYQLFDGTDGINNVRFSGDLGTDFGIDEVGFYHVRIAFDIAAFNDIAQGLVSIYVDNVLITSFTTDAGMLDNYIVLGGFSSSGLKVHGFDNLQVWLAIPAPAALPAGLALMALATLRGRRRRR